MIVSKFGEEWMGVGVLVVWGRGLTFMKACD